MLNLWIPWNTLPLRWVEKIKFLDRINEIGKRSAIPVSQDNDRKALIGKTLNARSETDCVAAMPYHSHTAFLLPAHPGDHIPEITRQSSPPYRPGVLPRC